MSRGEVLQPNLATPWFSPTDALGKGVVAATAGAGNFTVGCSINVTRPGFISGVRGYWGGGATTIKLAIWDTAGVLVRSVNVAVAGAGVVVGAFATILPIGAAEMWRRFFVSIYDTGATNYYFVTGAAWNAALLPFSSGGGAATAAIQVSPCVFLRADTFVAGDAAPTGPDANNYYPAEPIYTVMA